MYRAVTYDINTWGPGGNNIIDAGPNRRNPELAYKDMREWDGTTYSINCGVQDMSIDKDCAGWTRNQSDWYERNRDYLECAYWSGRNKY